MTQQDLYRTGIALAKELGRPLVEVPLSFQLNELEDYIRARQAELALRDRQPEVVELKDTGASTKR